MDYSELVKIYKELGRTSKRLEKTHILSEALKSADKKNLSKMILLSQGKLYPDWESKELGVAARIVIKALNQATGRSLDKIEETWKKTGDLGKTARDLTKAKKQATLFNQKLTIDKVFNNLQKLCEMTGSGTVNRKVQLISELLTSAEPDEAMYITRTVLEDLRIGVGDGVLRDAIAWAFADAEYKYEDGAIEVSDREKYNSTIEEVQEAYDLVLDFGLVAEILADKGLEGLKSLDLKPGRPIKSMLYQKASTIENAFATVGTPAAFEYKYDGFRIQIHIDGDEIMLFTRGREDVTKQFPDIVASVKEAVTCKNAILDSEAVGVDAKTGKYLAFQSVSQRIRRKHDIKGMAERFPVEVNVFDVLFHDDDNLLKTAFEKRRKTLEKSLKPLKGRIKASELIITDDEGKAEAFYNRALDAGHEGMMAKNLKGIYRPGARVGFGMKIKPVMDSLDLVIVGAEWGEGKRAHTLTSFTLACRTPDGLREIGRVSTGLKEKREEGVSYEQMTEVLTPYIQKEKGRKVTLRPKVVIEINFEEIQKSTTYSSGYALRFPRFIRLRDDRSIEDIDSIEAVEAQYSVQRNR